MQDEEFKPTDLDDILISNVIDEPEATVDDVPEVKPEAEPKAEKPEGEDKGDKPGETPTPKDEEQTPREKASYAAQQDEKRKRKEAQSDNERLRAENEALKKPKAEPKPIPDPIDDPEGFNAYTNEQTTTNNQTQADIRLNDKLNRSQYDVEKVHGEEKVAGVMDQFEGLCKKDPTLANKMFQHAHPYDFMMDHVEKADRHSEIDNIDDWKKEERKKIRAEVLAEGEGKAQELADTKDSIPETLGGESNQTGRDGKVITTHTPLEDIVTEIHDRKPRKRG